MDTALTTDGLINRFRRFCTTLSDPRDPSKTRYDYTDIMLGAFSVFFTQSPSFLSVSQAMQTGKGKNNARSLFGITRIPTDEHLRKTVDHIVPSTFAPLFRETVRTLGSCGLLTRFQTKSGSYLIALDGTWYCASTVLSCKTCLHKKDRGGETINYHSALTPVIVAPGVEQVVMLESEYLTPQDGSEKQDCEIEAGKRWVRESSQHYIHLGSLIILGDDLYSRQPFVQQLKDKNLSFILVCKAESHATITEYVATLKNHDDLEEVVLNTKEKGHHITTTYHYASDVPMVDEDQAIRVNYVEIEVMDHTANKRLYYNSFITDLSVTPDTVADIVIYGRTRWKVENESNNTLKTKGYHLEHNYGHGKEYLAATLACLTFISFLFHTVLDLGNQVYKEIRQATGARVKFFNKVRALTETFYFPSWDILYTILKRTDELWTLEEVVALGVG